MTDEELAAVIRGIAPVVRDFVTKALGETQTRLTAAETQLIRLPTSEHVAELRDRVVVMETKAAIPPPALPESAPPVDLAPIVERLATIETRLVGLGDVRDRLTVVETKAAQPPPALPTIPPPPDLTPFLERVSDLRDRLVTIETKTAMPPPPLPSVEKPVDLAPVLERLHVVEAIVDTMRADIPRAEGQIGGLVKEFNDLRERVAVVEVKPPVPGPPGEPGPPGKDGLNGKDGTAGLTFQGVYQDGKSYDFGDLVTWGGSSWHCNEATTSKPGDGSKAWTLMVKRGRDGKDGRDAVDPVPVVSLKRS